MQKRSDVILYSTDGCHLCEQALAMFIKLDVEPQVIDIAYDNTLYERYGVTIPVARYSENELSWPFNNEQLKHWLEDNGITYNT